MVFKSPARRGESSEQGNRLYASPTRPTVCKPVTSGPFSAPSLFNHLRTLLQERIRQLLCNHILPHSLQKTPGVGTSPETCSLFSSACALLPRLPEPPREGRDPYTPLSAFRAAFPATPSQSVRSALFCATGTLQLLFFQTLPHSFYRHEGGYPQSPGSPPRPSATQEVDECAERCYIAGSRNSLPLRERIKKSQSHHRARTLDERTLARVGHSGEGVSENHEKNLDRSHRVGACRWTCGYFESAGVNPGR